MCGMHIRDLDGKNERNHFKTIVYLTFSISFHIFVFNRNMLVLQTLALPLSSMQLQDHSKLLGRS